jgi:5'-methylthioadenosine phosphorylase
LRKTKAAIIGGTGFGKLAKDAKRLQLRTPYGMVPQLAIGEIGNRRVAFISRHGPNHSIPPHKINYRAIIYGLHKIGVERIISTASVGAINPKLGPGDVVIPHDFIDFTKLRPTTFYDEAPVTHIDVSQPYCPEIRRLLIENARRLDLRVCDKAVMVCTEGPRFETPSEIEMFRRLGGDIVGMTNCPEAVLARELEMCFGTICYVSNLAAGMQERLTATEVSDASGKIRPLMEQVLFETIKALPLEGKRKCPCAGALRRARFQ